MFASRRIAQCDRLERRNPDHPAVQATAMTSASGALSIGRKWQVNIRCVCLVVVLTTVAAVLLLGPVDAAGGQRPVTASQTSTPPRTPDGQPDLQGYWRSRGGGAHSIEEGGAEPAQVRMSQGRDPTIGGPVAPVSQFKSPIVDPPEGKIPYQPWAFARKRQHLENMFAPTRPEHIEPEDRCLSAGVPRIFFRGPFRIVQRPEYLIVMHEWNHDLRIIPLDGRPHIPPTLKLWNGDSRGRWDGNTLVVDVTNFHVDPVHFATQPWFDSHGTFYSDALHVVERWTLLDANTIRYEATMDDPKVLTKPWKLVLTFQRIHEAGFELLEEACTEGNETTVLTLMDSGRVTRDAGVRGIHTHNEEELRRYQEDHK